MESDKLRRYLTGLVREAQRYVGDFGPERRARTRTIARLDKRISQSDRPELTADGQQHTTANPSCSSSVHAPICTSTGLLVSISHENWIFGLP